mgnify:CR=1 FL=1
MVALALESGDVRAVGAEEDSWMVGQIGCSLGCERGRARHVEKALLDWVICFAVFM